MVEAKSPTSSLQETTHVSGGLNERGPEEFRLDLFECREWCATRRDDVDIAQQPVKREVVTATMPLGEVLPQRGPCLGPISTNLRQGQIALRQLRTPRVHPVEDVHDIIHGLVRTGDQFLVEI